MDLIFPTSTTRVLHVVLVAVAAFPSAGEGQTSLRLRPGQQIELTAPNCGMRRERTTLQAIHGDTLVLPADLDISSSLRICPLRSVTRLRVIRGQSTSIERALSYSMAGGLLGGLVGAGIGAAICAGDACDDENAGFLPFVTAGMGGVVGLLAGFVVGAWPRNEWQDVRLGRLRVYLPFQRDGTAVRVSVRL